MADDTLANEVDEVAREVQGNRAKLLYVLRSGGFPALARAFERDTAGEQLEGEREYVGAPAPEAPRAGSAGIMAYADGALNLFRPPPMPGAQVEQAVPGVLPVHAATEAESVEDPDATVRARAAAVLRQRGIYAPTDGQLADVLAASPWLGRLATPEPELFVDSSTDGPFAPPV